MSFTTEKAADHPVDAGAATAATPQCHHCGLPCDDPSIRVGDKCFCCNGCKAVFQILTENNLDAYYTENPTPGTRPAEAGGGEGDAPQFAYLDHPCIRDRLLEFSDGATARYTLQIPQVHCTSCVLLLEHLSRLHPGIGAARVNFPRRELTVTIEEDRITLRELVELLARIGYEPMIALEGADREDSDRRRRRSVYLKLGVAGFAFANTMLFGLPEYLAGAQGVEPGIARLLRYGSILLAIPVLLYSAAGYFRSALTGLRERLINIDVPIALGILALFGRSVYDIAFGLGSGYLDSFCALVFLLLLGRLFQQKTYDRLSFDRDYRSYFPLAVLAKRHGGDTTVPVTELVLGDRIVIRNREIVPADAILVGGEACLDYSFVTGESDPTTVNVGAKVYAGARQIGGAIELEVVREVSQSYLTRLWNDSAFQRGTGHGLTSLANRVARYFTGAVLAIAGATALYWFPRDAAVAINAVTAVLIVACPCALALTTPFVLGTAMRILGRHRLYLRGSDVVESLARIDAIVFDKTGTLTHTTQPGAGDGDRSTMPEEQRRLIAAVVRHSTHPKSRRLLAALGAESGGTVTAFVEEPGEGVAGVVAGHRVRIGRETWTLKGCDGTPHGAEASGGGDHSDVYWSIDGRVRGRFVLPQSFRAGFEDLIGGLRPRYALAVISGDHGRHRARLEASLGDGADVRFDQSPREKLDYVRRVHAGGQRVLMIGDGLNDAGALAAADVGIALTEDTATFTPASDGILDAAVFGNLGRFLRLARRSTFVIVAGFVISFIYNFVGLGFAVTGHLSPLVSAILMPLSSVTVVVFATVATQIQAARSGL